MTFSMVCDVLRYAILGRSGVECHIVREYLIIVHCNLIKTVTSHTVSKDSFEVLCKR